MDRATRSDEEFSPRREKSDSRFAFLAASRRVSTSDGASADESGEERENHDGGREGGRESEWMHSARLVGRSAGRPARDNAMQWKSSATPYRGLVYTNHRPMEAIILIRWPSIEPLSSFRSRIIKVARRRDRDEPARQTTLESTRTRHSPRTFPSFSKEPRAIDRALFVSREESPPRKSNPGWKRLERASRVRDFGCSAWLAGKKGRVSPNSGKLRLLASSANTEVGKSGVERPRPYPRPLPPSPPPPPPALPTPTPPSNSLVFISSVSSAFYF